MKNIIKAIQEKNTLKDIYFYIEKNGICKAKNPKSYKELQNIISSYYNDKKIEFIRLTENQVIFDVNIKEE